MLTRHCFYYYPCIEYLKIKFGDTFGPVFTLRNCFGCPGSFEFPYEFGDFFSQFPWSELGISWDGTEFLNWFGRMTVFTISTLPIEEHGKCFHLWEFSSITLFNILVFHCRSFFYFLAQIYNMIFQFWRYCEYNYSVTSFSVFFLIVYDKVNDFYVWFVPLCY